MLFLLFIYTSHDGYGQLIIYDPATSTSTSSGASPSNIGINITAPTQALDIYIPSMADCYSRFTNSSYTTGLLIGIDASGNAVFKHQENTDMVFSTNSAERIRILAGGNVGIGTTTPTQLLDVNGGANISGLINVGGLGTFTSGISVSGATGSFTSGIDVSGTIGNFTDGLSVSGAVGSFSSGINVSGSSGIFSSGINVSGSTGIFSSGINVSGSSGLFGSGIDVSGAIGSFADGISVSGAIGSFTDGITVSGATGSFNSGVDVNGVILMNPFTTSNMPPSTTTNKLYSYDASGSGTPVGNLFWNSTILNVWGMTTTGSNIYYNAGKMGLGTGTSLPLATLQITSSASSTTDGNLLVGPIGSLSGAGAVMSSGSSNGFTFVDRAIITFPTSPSAGNFYQWFANGNNAFLSTPVLGNILTADNTGNIGIGIAPAEKLDLNGALMLEPFTTSNVPPSTTTNRLYSYNPSSATSGDLFWNGKNISAQVLPSGSTNATLRSTGSSWVSNNYLENDGTSQIGMGTSINYGSALLNITTTGSNPFQFFLSRTGYSTEAMVGTSASGLRFLARDNSTLTTPFFDMLQLNKDGNVGIGTTDPPEALHINQVGNGWSTNNAAILCGPYNFYWPGIQGAIKASGTWAGFYFQNRDMLADKSWVTGNNQGEWYSWFSNNSSLSEDNNKGVARLITDDKQILKATSNSHLEIGTPNAYNTIYDDAAVKGYMGASSFWRLSGDATNTPIKTILESGNTDAYLPIYFRQTKGSTSRDAVVIDNIGNVGIGSTAPLATLQVTSIANPTTDGNMIVGPIGTVSGAGIIMTSGNNNGFYFVNRSLSTYPSSPVAGDYFQWYASGGKAALWTPNTNDIITCDGTTGYVGIGVGSPSNKLEVCGTIRAKEVDVDGSAWCDYVFDKGYKMMSLAEVDKFIRKNHHLPEVPTTAEVEKDGIKIGAMTALLLKKTEEGTLRDIEMQKLVEKLIKENEELKARVEKLEAK